MAQHIQFINYQWVLSFVYCQEGNYKLENYGNETALLNGNVMGSISDPSF